jgi:hypothetical protein
MQDVTAYFSTYRECARHLWNTYFQPTAEKNTDWDLRDHFADTACLLFKTLIAHPLGISDFELTPDYFRNRVAHPSFHVVPRSESGVPILINREKPRSGYWDHPLKQICPTDAELHFINFFDFDVLGFRNYQYFEVSIYASAKYPDVVGRDVLIDCTYAKIYYQPPKDPS